MSRITVIGDGGWGTALALLLHANGHQVRIWGPFADYMDLVRDTGYNERYLPGVELPPELKWEADREKAVREAEAVVLAVPSRWFEEVVRSFVAFLPPRAMVMSVTKGLERGGGRRMSQVAEEILGRRPVTALSGPSHAEEVARGVPTAVVAACDDHDCACRWQQLFAQRCFRVYSSDDVVGVELGGALKNVMALAAGMACGMKMGDNATAALITRGLAEMRRLGCALGAQVSTFAGLSGMGDLIVTCMSSHSRNRRVGERLGCGETLASVTDGMQQVAEGIWTSAGAFDLARRLDTEAPIINEVYAVIHEQKDPRAAVEDLLARAPRPEDE